MERRKRSVSVCITKNSRKNTCSDEDNDGSSEEKKEKNPRHFSLSKTCRISGKDVYGFKTPKRKNGMAEKASRSSSSKIVSSHDKHELRMSSKSLDAASAGRSSSKAASKPTTPIGLNDTDATVCPVQTPYSLRRRIKQRLVKMTESQDVSDSDEDGSSTDVSEDSDKEITRRHHGRTSSKPPCRRQNRTDSQQATAENYFVAHDQKSKTSDNTLARLKVSRFDRDMLDGTLNSVPISHEMHCKYMMSNYRQYFPKWIFQLSQGFNLLLHGLGSKHTLLKEFRELLMRDNTVLVVNGFFPSVSVKQILSSITNDVLEHKGEFSRPEDQVEFISKTIPNSDVEKLYVIINNIDGVMLRNERAQNILCNLAQIGGLHLVASIDHINAPLLWDQARLSGFNWIWYDVTTFLPYIHETSYENSLLVQQTGSLTLSSVSHVFKSLTPNAQRIFQLLAEFQLNHDKSNYIGMAFQDYFHKCHEKFLVNSELTLKAQLTEFKDHKLIRTKKGVDGAEYLQILLDNTTLSELVQQQKEISA